MNCPYCEEEMEPGFIQSGTHMIFTDKIHKVSILPREHDIYLAKNFLRGASVTAFLCRNCQKILVDYSDIHIE